MSASLAYAIASGVVGLWLLALAALLARLADDVADLRRQLERLTRDQGR